MGTVPTRIAATLILLAALAGCERSGTPAPGESTRSTSPVVARVDGHAIREADIDAEVDLLPEQFHDYRDDPSVRRRILDALVRRQLLSGKALEMGLDTDPVIHQRIARARDNILINALEEWKLSHLPAPTEEEIAAYYEEHKEDFSLPEQIHARHILVGSEEEAKEIHTTLQRGGDFAALAATHSLDDSNKARGGDLNWFSRGMMVKPFEEAAFALKAKNDVSRPVKTRFGWHVIQLLGRRPASEKGLDESREEIVTILQQRALERWIETLTDEADIEVEKAAYRAPEENGAVEMPRQ